MRHLVVAPDGQALGGLLFVQGALRVALCRVGADERASQVEHRAALQDEADTSQDAVYFPIRAETVAIDQRQALRLLYQFFVCHVFPRKERRVYDTVAHAPRHKNYTSQPNFYLAYVGSAA